MRCKTKTKRYMQQTLEFDFSQEGSSNHIIFQEKDFQEAVMHVTTLFSFTHHYKTII